MRYFVYDIDKHQASPRFFAGKPPAHEWGDADDGYTVIVDLVDRKRYWLGTWADVDVWPGEDKRSTEPAGSQ